MQYCTYLSPRQLFNILQASYVNKKRRWHLTLQEISHKYARSHSPLTAVGRSQEQYLQAFAADILFQCIEFIQSYCDDFFEFSDV